MVITEKSYAYPGSDLKRSASNHRVVNGQSKWNTTGRVSGGENDFFRGISDAAEKTLEKNDGKVLGLTTLPGKGNMSYGMIAQYAADSTKEDPIIQVTANYEGKRVSYKVHVNEVNPENASALEMFALCSYSDDAGISDGGALGSWQKLKTCAGNAAHNGQFGSIEDAESFFGKSLDWLEMIGYMAIEYRKAGIYNQYQSCLNLKAMMSRFSGNSKKSTGALINNAAKENGEASTEALMQIIREHREEILKKLENGETGQKIQIGGMSLTEEEWEKLMDSFDRAEEAIQQAVKAEQGEELPEKRPDTTINGNTVLAPPEDTGHEAKSLEQLVADSTTCHYPADETPEGVMYITCYTAEGITCKKAGETDALWSISFTEKGCYEKVMDFLEQFDKTDNLRFTSSKKFWEDFLSGELDMDGFMDFYKTTDKGVPDYLIRKETGTYIDTEKAKYAKYMNSPEAAEMIPVEDLASALMMPFQLPGETFVHPEENEISLGEGAKIRVGGDYILTITRRGIQISGGNPDEAKSRSSWQAGEEMLEMVWALSALLHDVAGQTGNMAKSAEEYRKWNRGISGVLDYLGLDGKRDFTINGTKYTKDGRGNFVKA